MIFFSDFLNFLLFFLLPGYGRYPGPRKTCRVPVAPLLCGVCVFGCEPCIDEWLVVLNGFCALQICCGVTL